MKKAFFPLSSYYSYPLVKLSLFLLLILLSTSVNAQQVIQLYKGAAPGSENWNWEEKETSKNPLNTRIVYNVTHPTLTAFLPNPSLANGTAVIVCPGGGYQVLIMDWEGVDIARWLNEKGITAFVLKYRTGHLVTNDPWGEMIEKINSKTFFKDVAPVLKLELEDAKTSMAYIRKHAAEYGIDPERVGIMGFSAGGALSASLAYNYTSLTRPNFSAPFYAPVDSIQKSGVPSNAPPLFIAAATDDELVPASNSIHLYSDWLAAKRSAELHIFSKGGHGFDLKKQNLPVDTWKDLFIEWLNAQGLLKKKK
jgi:acetyl esterase/lipase